MRANYDKESDILTIQLSAEQIDHATEVDNIIVHVDPANRPVLLEILDASDFLAKANQLVKTPGGNGFHDIAS